MLSGGLFLGLLTLKQRLVGTGLGRFGAHCRHLWETWHVLRSKPELCGMLGQDICAKRLLPHLCSSSKVFLDIGAHIGSVIADVRRRHPSIRLIAIEAVPEKSEQLIRSFRNIEVLCLAAGDVDGQVEFFVDDIRPGYSSLFDGEHHRKTQGRKISTPMRRLDGLFPDTTDVDVIKLDVEGAELRVLVGASNLVDRCRPVILFESGPRKDEDGSSVLGELFDWFASRKYELFVPDRVAHDGPPLYRDGFLEAHFYPFRTLDYFAIPAERRIEIRDRARTALGVLVAVTPT